MGSNRKAFNHEELVFYMDEKILEDIGLTGGEIKVYLSLLKSGEATTGIILKNAQISGGKVYQILDKLISKGLVSFITKNNVKYFQAASPKRILDFYGRERENFQNKEEKLKQEISSMLSNIKVNENNSVNLFMGLKGIETAIFEALNGVEKGEEILAMGVILSKEEKFNILWEKWHHERIRKKINCRMLLSEKQKSFLDKMNFTQFKILEGITPSAVSIFKDRIIIYDYSNESGCVVIKNKGISESFKTFFENLWKIAKK